MLSESVRAVEGRKRADREYLFELRGGNGVFRSKPRRARPLKRWSLAHGKRLGGRQRGRIREAAVN